MKLKYLIPCLVALLLAAPAAFAQTTLAQWTFESVASGLSYVPGAGVATTNFYAEGGAQAGVAAMTGWHFGFGTPTYSSPAGNPGRSLSANGWTNSAAAATGDYYQAAFSTLGYQSIGVSFDQYSSSTGPGRFYLAYSTDGSTFTQFGSIYNSGNGVWITNTVDLSSISAIENQATVYIRLVDANNTAANGTGIVGTTGTCRIDNFTVTGVIPGPPSIATQPADANIYKGDAATFTVVAGGSAPLAFQWYYTNSSGVVALVDGPSGYGVGTISNSATATLGLTYVDPGQAGGYFVVVTNSSGSITSSVAALTVGIRTPIVTTIYNIRTNQTTAWLPADTTNLYTVTGTVTTPFNMTSPSSSEFFIQDASGEGICVFVGGGTYVPNLGDSVQVTGPIGQFDGLLELNLSVSNPTHSVNFVSSGNPVPAPKSFDFASLTNIAYVETNIEGSLVVVSNVFIQQPQVAGFVSAATVNLTNVNGKLLNLYVNANATDVIGSTAPPFASSIIGVFSQHATSAPYTNSYELDILQYAGLVTGTMASIPMTVQTVGGNAVVTWNASLFGLQSSTNVAGPYTTITGAASPYTDGLTNAANFYRLVH